VSIYDNEMTFAATRCIIWAFNASRMYLQLGLNPEPHWGSLHYIAARDPLTGGEGTCCPSPKPFPTLGLRSSISNNDGKTITVI